MPPDYHKHQIEQHCAYQIGFNVRVWAVAAARHEERAVHREEGARPVVWDAAAT